MIGNTRITQAMKNKMAELENPFYLYDQETILGQVRRLHRDFPDFEFLYSIKTNPFLPVVKTILGEGLGLDAASLREVEIGVEYGLPKEKILYSAPGKTERDLRGAMDHAILIADSLHELDIIRRIAAEKGETPAVGVRINPNFTFAADEGVAGKFGIDEAALWNADLSGLNIVGIHVHAKSQELSADVLAHYYENMFSLIERVQQHLGVTLRFANFGSGLGIPFAPGEEPLDVEGLGKRFQEMHQACAQKWPQLKILIESGRYIVGKSGTYVTRVLDKKVSHGKTFVLLYGTLNGFARPAVGEMVRSLSDHPFPYEPIFTHVQASALLPLTDHTDTETVTLAGNLCTSADIIARDITLPRMEIGDGLALDNAGCYAAVMTPMQFAFLTPPAQLFLTADGRVMEA